MSNTTQPAPVRLRRLVPTALLAAVAALGASTFASPAIASADRVLDIGAYLDCVDQAILDGVAESDNEGNMANERCCEENGGDFNWAEKVCEAPPAEEEVQHTPRPAHVAPAGAAPLTAGPPAPVLSRG